MKGLWAIAQKAERIWWNKYLKKKDVSEYQNWKLNYWKNLLTDISEHLEISPEDSIADVGCGPAGIFMAFPNHSVTASDPLIEAYEEDLPHFKKAYYPYVEFLSYPIENLPVDKTFDVVFCMNAINHVSEIQKGYETLFQLLKPGGKLVISIDAHNYSFFKHLFRIFKADILHPCQYDLNEYANFLTERKLKILGTKKLKSEFFFNYYVQIAQKDR